MIIVPALDHNMDYLKTCYEDKGLDLTAKDSNLL